MPKANSTPLFVPDSLVAFDGTSFRAVKDTVGNYSVTLPFSAANQFSLYEHLALGLGRDTLILPQGHTVTATSPVGHQLKVDSSSAPSVSQYPNMGNFTKGFAFTWPGRSLNDSLIIEFRKTHAKQKLYRIDALKETAVAPLHEDSLKSTLALTLADSSKTFFLARRYLIAANVKTSFALGKDSVIGIVSTTAGDLDFDSSYTISGLNLDTLRILAKRKVSLDGLKIQSAYSIEVDGQTPGRINQVIGFVREGLTWSNVAVTLVNKKFRVEIRAGVTELVVAERLSPGDSLPVYPVAKPTLTILAGQLAIKPVLSAEEKIKTQSFRVEAIYMDVNGVTSTKTLVDVSADSSAKLIPPPATLVTYRVGYVNYSGKTTWDSVFTQAALDPKPFIDEVNKSAVPFKTLVWDLVGFPQVVSASSLLEPFAQSTERAKLFEWKGGWVEIEKASQLKKGGGYLLGVPGELKPVLANQAIPVTDSLTLDSGWNCIASPLPIPIADEHIKLDSGSVSFFFALVWEGQGKSAIPRWSLAETLKPFKGYAVYAFKKTVIRFNLFQTSPSLFKKAVSSKSRTHFQLTENGQVAELFVRDNIREVAQTSPPFLTADFRAAWNRVDGSIVAGPAKLQPFFVHSQRGGQVFMSVLSSNDLSKPYSVWNHATQAFSKLQPGSSLAVVPGNNAFTLVSAREGELAGIENELRRSSQVQFSITSIVYNRHSEKLRIDFSLSSSNAAISDAQIEIFNLFGKKQAQHSASFNSIGKNTVTIPTKNMPNGVYFVKTSLIINGVKRTLVKRVSFDMGGR